ncbi:MAG: hypothetical protein JSU63_22160 [Phycisphaerales bacterium]|nr:MAG: hypothetical protein JSU63_22160 [Phycisphaerales bacterium]
MITGFARALGVLTVVILVSPAVGQDYEIRWSTVSSGGISYASAEGYTLAGTVGQAFAGTCSAGDYGLTSGFVVSLPLNAPALPADSEHQARKNRHISLDPSTSGSQEIALEVVLASMRRCSENLARACATDEDCQIPLPDEGTCVEHPHADSSVGWVQEPFHYCDPAHTCDPNDWFATIGPDPYFAVWDDIDTLHVGDCEIIPVATYEVYATRDAILFSYPLEVGTILKPAAGDYYGDVSGGSSDGITLNPPDGYVNIKDIQAYLLTQDVDVPFAHVTWIDLHGGLPGEGNPPQQILNVSDLQQILLGDQGTTYTGTADLDHMDPCDCPHTQCQ